MAKRKRGAKRQQQKNLVDIKRKSEVAFKFAYSLFLAPRNSGAERLVKKLQVLRKKELPGETLEAGTSALVKYERLMLSASEAFESLCLVLLRATTDNRLREQVLDIILSSFIYDAEKYLNKQSALVRLGQAEDPAELAAEIDDCEDKSAAFLRYLCERWAGIDEYIDLLGAWEDISEKTPDDMIYNLLESDDIITSTFTSIGKYVRSENFEDSPSDADEIMGYENDSPFYKSMSKEAMDMITSLLTTQSEVYSGKLGFDRVFRRNLWFRGSLEERKEIAREMEATKLMVLSEDACKKDDSMSDLWWDQEKIWLAGTLAELRYEYLLAGIDIDSVIIKTSFQPKNGKAIIKKAFILYDQKYEIETDGEKCPYTREADKEGVARLIVHLWVQEMISAQVQSLLGGKKQTKGASEHKELADALSLIDTLKRENEKLRVSEDKSAESKSEELKRKNEELKALRARLHDANSELKKKEEAIKTLEEENKDLRSIFELEMDEDATETSPTKMEVTEDFFREYIKEHKVLIWGLRDSTEQKYMKLYPELSFVGSERRLTKQQLESYDVFIMCTSNTNHANYWSARDTAKAHGIKMAYLAKSMNDPKHLWWALGIALGGKREELKHAN